MILPTALITSSLLSHLIEAYLESIFGDKKHYISFLIQITFLTAIGMLAGYPFYVGAILISTGRAFFDWMYNWFEGKHYTYLGKYAATDNMLKQILEFGIPNSVVTVARAVLFAGAAALMYIIQI